jgi:hypothetical protein
MTLPVHKIIESSTNLKTELNTKLLDTTIHIRCNYHTNVILPSKLR